MISLILKKDNVERIVESAVLIEKLVSDGWIEVTPEKKKPTKKEKQEVAE